MFSCCLESCICRSLFRPMGLLDFDGEPLDWKDIEPHVEYVKHHGIVQFLNNYERLIKRPEDSLKWGDEVCNANQYFFITLKYWHPLKSS